MLNVLSSTTIHILQWGLICFSFANYELVGLKFAITTVETGNCERTFRMINQNQLLNFN